jgi:hypothetical protein
MRLHSDVLTGSDITRIFHTAKAAHMSPETYIEYTSHGSRSRQNAFEVRLGAYAKRAGERRSYKNSGGYGASEEYAATYDEWGHFIEALFTVDPDMIFGGYKGVDDYHAQTRFLFCAVVPTPDPYPHITEVNRRRWRDAEPSKWVASSFEPRDGGPGWSADGQARDPRYTAAGRFGADHR